MVKIRLMRMGAKKRPYFRVVIADSRSPRDGRFIENIGRYHPLSHPSVIEIDGERALHWLGNGAQPTEAVRNLLVKTGIWGTFQGGPGTPVPPPPEEKAKPAAAEAVPAEPTEEPSEKDAGSAEETPAAPPEETRAETPEETAAEASEEEAGGEEK